MKMSYAHFHQQKKLFTSASVLIYTFFTVHKNLITLLSTPFKLSTEHAIY